MDWLVDLAQEGSALRILTLAVAPVGRISVEAGDAALTVSAGCQVLALLTHALIDTLAVTVTLTSCQRVNTARSEKKCLINSLRPKHEWIC